MKKNMTQNFEHQLSQMLPLIREREATTTRLHPVALTLIGFVLGVCVTYSFMQPNDTPPNREPQNTYRLVLDESNLHEIQRPADVFRYVVSVPVQKPVDESVQWRYSTLRNSLMQL
jgi:hypothetical protein